MSVDGADHRAPNPAALDLDLRLEIPSTAGLGQLTDVEVLEDGRVLALDRGARRIAVFDRKGQLVKVIGRPGDASGGLPDGVAKILFMAPDELMLPSAVDASITVLDLNGKFRRRIPIPIDVRATLTQQFTAGPNKSIVYDTRPSPFAARLPAAQRLEGLYLVEVNGSRVVHKLRLGRGDGVTGLRPILYTPVTRWATTRSGQVIVGDGSAYEFRILSWAGDVVQEVRKAHSPSMITPADREFLYGEIERWFRSQPSPPPFVSGLRMLFGFASHYPAYTKLLADDSGRIWVQLPATASYIKQGSASASLGLDIGSAIWDVFDEHGTFLSQIAFPSGFRLARVKSNTAYGYLRGGDGIQTIEAWGIAL